MSCYKPLRAERLDDGTVQFKNTGGQSIDLPCGQCIGCKLEAARQMAGRCVNEAQLHTDNSFVTLTYNDENLPKGATLVKKHLQDFHKRLRYYHAHRYYSCGEYGEQTWRPHYHSILFGYMPKDIKLYNTSPQGHRIYTSEELNKIWGYGECKIGAVTFESAGYCARYALKKRTGSASAMHYVRPHNGELTELEPEFSIMSRHPGIGAKWYEKHSNDVIRRDLWIVNGVQGTPPRYYDKLYRRINPKEYEYTKSDRTNKAAEYADNNTEPRLIVREKVKQAQTKALKRTL